MDGLDAETLLCQLLLEVDGNHAIVAAGDHSHGSGPFVERARVAERTRRLRPRIGDLAVAAGDLPAARTAFTASLTIRQRLADADPSNTEWQRDLSISHERLKDLD